jgi:hypothetical protein
MFDSILSTNFLGKCGITRQMMMIVLQFIIAIAYVYIAMDHGHYKLLKTKDLSELQPRETKYLKKLRTEDT